ncbi:MAG: hypothetical protein AAGA03_17775 [Planctomycetota bacterium]
MRSIIFTIVICCAHGLSAADREPVQLESEPPFTAHSTGQNEHPLVLLVVTDDDCYVANETPLWCDASLHMRWGSLLQQRPGLHKSMVVQRLRAGPPSFMRGQTKPRPGQRVLMLLCDPQYRLLGLSVGLPDTEGFLQLIEDAEETASILQLAGDDDQSSLEQLADRTRQRAYRLWREAFDLAWTEFRDGDYAAKSDESRKEPQAMLLAMNARLRLGLIDRLLSPTYATDVRRRFHVDWSANRARLIALEQHAETRQAWCDAVTPMLVGTESEILWRPLTELVWGQPTITRQPLNQEIASWWKTNHPDSTVSLTPTSEFRLSDPPDPVAATGLSDKAAKRVSQGWQQLQDLLLQHPHRTISLDQLAALYADQELPSVDLLLPQAARHLLFTANRPIPMMIRPNELPGKYISQVQRMSR